MLTFDFDRFLSECINNTHCNHVQETCYKGICKCKDELIKDEKTCKPGENFSRIDRIIISWFVSCFIAGTPSVQGTGFFAMIINPLFTRKWHRSACSHALARLARFAQIAIRNGELVCRLTWIMLDTCVMMSSVWNWFYVCFITIHNSEYNRARCVKIKKNTR